MTGSSFASFILDHWVLLALVLCPITIVLMALSALTCEVCGAPFGIFRRRSRTIDLCIRCALLHDMRRAKELREDHVMVDEKTSETVSAPDSPTSIREESRFTAQTSSNWT